MRLKAAFFDMDGTMTDANYFARLYTLAGLDPEKDNLWNKYMAGEYATYEDALKPLAAALRAKGVKRWHLSRLFADIAVTKGLSGVVYDLQNAGVKCFVVSCGSDHLLDKINTHIIASNGCGFDDALCVQTRFNGFGMIDSLVPMVEYKDKGSGVRRFQKEYGFKKDQCMAVGDGIGDVGMFKECSLNFLYNVNEWNLNKIKALEDFDYNSLIVLESGHFADILDYIE